LLKQFVEISRSNTKWARTRRPTWSAERNCQLKNRPFDFQREISDAQTQLNTLMNGRPDAAWQPLPWRFQPVSLSLEKVEGLALAQRPELFMAEQKSPRQARPGPRPQGMDPERPFGWKATATTALHRLSASDRGLFHQPALVQPRKYKSGIGKIKKSSKAPNTKLASVRVDTLGMVRTSSKKSDLPSYTERFFRANCCPGRTNRSSPTPGLRNRQGKFLELLSRNRLFRKSNPCIGTIFRTIKLRWPNWKPHRNPVGPTNPQPNIHYLKMKLKHFFTISPLWF